MLIMLVETLAGFQRGSDTLTASDLELSFTAVIREA
jgi:hypothetical protein